MTAIDISGGIPWTNIPIGIAVGVLLFRELVRALKTRDFFGVGYVHKDQVDKSHNGSSGEKSVEFWAERIRLIVETAVDNKLQLRTDALYRTIENTISSSVQQTHAGRQQLERMLDKIIDNENIILRQLYIAQRNRGNKGNDE